MRRDEVLHVARAAANAAGVRRVLVVGSQAVLGTHSEGDLPSRVLESVEADIVVLDDLDGNAHQAVEAGIGYMSLFHATHGYHAEGVEAGTAVLPEGWEGRVLTMVAPDTGGQEVTVHFPELHDLCVSKLAAARIKDREFVNALLGAGLVDGSMLVERAQRIRGVHAAVGQRTVELARALWARHRDPG